MEQKFKELVDTARRIVITSHVSPDADAVCSSVLLSEILRVNFPDKVVTTALEEHPARDLRFIAGYDKITFGSLRASIEAKKPDLLIITDTEGFNRISKQHGDAIRQYVKAHGVKTIIIDHHQWDIAEPTDVVIDRGVSCASQEIYHLCFTVLGMKRPDGYDLTTMVGIIEDTNRFMYHYPHYSETMKIAGELIEGGIDIQKLDARLRRYNRDQMLMVEHLISNLQIAQSYTYTFVSDEFAQQWLKAGKDIADFKRGKADFVDQYIRNMGENLWGFVVAQDLTAPNTYFTSFRASRGARDVAELAQSLNGGGHAESAAAKIESPNISDALQVVIKAIDSAAGS